MRKRQTGQVGLCHHTRALRAGCEAGTAGQPARGLPCARRLPVGPPARQSGGIHPIVDHTFDARPGVFRQPNGQPVRLQVGRGTGQLDGFELQAALGLVPGGREGQIDLRFG